MTNWECKHCWGRGPLASADPRTLGPIAIWHFRSFVCFSSQGAWVGQPRPPTIQGKRPRRRPALAGRAAPGRGPRQGLRSAPPFLLRPPPPPQPPPPHSSFLSSSNSSHLLLCSSLFSLRLSDPRTLLDLLFRQAHAVAMSARPSASELLPSPFFCPSSANRTINLELLSPSPACLSLHSTDLWSPLPGNASLVGKSQALVCGTGLGEGNRNSRPRGVGKVEGMSSSI